ncbi:carboxypeptidase regulatory-like domain-containing protein, partial [Aeribacillus pallidus]|uniref:carboxypeptidase regulatory-like domain-containing protein n=1 Tax=Aeribacillus pallidus TaxID=33936 RepID=UPI003D1BE092
MGQSKYMKFVIIMLLLFSMISSNLSTLHVQANSNTDHFTLTNLPDKMTAEFEVAIVKSNEEEWWNHFLHPHSILEDLKAIHPEKSYTLSIFFKLLDAHGKFVGYYHEVREFKGDELHQPYTFQYKSDSVKISLLTSSTDFVNSRYFVLDVENKLQVPIYADNPNSEVYLEPNREYKIFFEGINSNGEYYYVGKTFTFTNDQKVSLFDVNVNAREFDIEGHNEQRISSFSLETLESNVWYGFSVYNFKGKFSKLITNVEKASLSFTEQYEDNVYYLWRMELNKDLSSITLPDHEIDEIDMEIKSSYADPDDNFYYIFAETKIISNGFRLEHIYPEKGVIVVSDQEGNIIFEEEESFFNYISTKLANLKQGKYTLTLKFPFHGETKEISDTFEVKQDLSEVNVQDVTFLLVDQNDQPIQENLYVRITDDQHYFYGKQTKKGENGATLTVPNMYPGVYNVFIQGKGIYLDTNLTIEVPDEEIDYSADPIKLPVKTIPGVEIADVTLNVNGILPEDSLVIDNVYLYSPSQEFWYHTSNENVVDGKIVLSGLIAADDYFLSINKEGYIHYYQHSVQIKANEENVIDVELEKGRNITGQLIAPSGSTLIEPYVYAMDSEFNYYGAKVQSDGSFTVFSVPVNEAVKLYIEAKNAQKMVMDVERDQQDVGTIQLKQDVAYQGTVVNENNEPLSGAYVYVYQNDQYISFTRTDQNGQFSIRGLDADTSYTYEINHWDYPIQQFEAKLNGTYQLKQLATGDFTGEGNELISSADTVVQGKNVKYRIKYQNNGNGQVDNAIIKISLDDALTLSTNKGILNGKEVTLQQNGQTVIVDLGTVKDGENGSLLIEATLNKTEKDVIFSTAEIVNKDEKRLSELLSASTIVLNGTINAPSKVSTKKVKIYGSAKPGTNVEVYVNGVLAEQATSNYRYWYGEVELPIKNIDEAETFQVTAKIIDKNESFTTAPVTIEYTPDLPQITDVKVSAGWNGEVSLNPDTNVATFAIVETTPLDTTVTFNKEVLKASIRFLGKDYEMTNQGNNTYFFDGEKLGKWRSSGEQLFELVVETSSGEFVVPLMEVLVLIDPSGYVFEGSMDNRLEGVQAIVQEKLDGTWLDWDAAKYGQINPQITDEQGRYGWDVLAGEWRVKFTKEGYEDYISRVVTVPPPETELNVPMVRKGYPVVESVTPSNNSTDVKIDTTITVKFDRLMNQENMEQLIQLFEVGTNGQETVVDVEFTFENYKGYKEVPADKTGAEDSNGQSGWFEEDPTKRLSKTVVLKPKTTLKESQNYKLVVSKDLVDYAGKSLDSNKDQTIKDESDFVVTFKTESSSSENGSSDPIGDTGGGAPVTPSPSTVVWVNESDIKQAITDKDKVTLSYPSNDELELKVSPAVLSMVGEDQKGLTVQTKEITLDLPSSVVKQLAEEATGTITLKVVPKNQSSTPKVDTSQTFLSDVYDFTISVEKNGKVEALTTFVEPVTIKMNVDSKGVKDKRKV